ncbi:hypothetical protein KCTC52924_00139 [Arenibacter antarcticus]|uniref:YceI family protein n=1 Tax=Arenibacter antarcticus TaxID=2040469 RepID=A0ABW5VJD4_9FLAO|nr:YceI family protein [Arenibacter sp. H213]MCM4169095.1 hypothetical protein [Arenibacter sp. H213]
MKKVLGFTTILLLLAFNFKDSPVNHSVITIAPESRLMISGTTNINTFSCDFDTDRLKEPIPVHFEKIGEKYIFQKATLVLNNFGFDCGNRGINRDFHDLLESEEYPQIELKLKEIIGDILNASALTAVVEIKIAGIKNSYRIPVAIADNKPSCVSGALKLSLGDFKLKAPKKALGLIVVHDSITINFDLELQMG